ncbi:hypothetical protein [Spartinivicinus poritis]|uniref:Uncharacterized protein n=1 Tax=Spartinivicinus poritis TaxID=2994640 RepID=A0ABT5UEV0_9GAMM|nr:hypothetical protein [Spartinivicinus sp. A2-2]MDE1464913.1 hypothetical protein [Spartinivicinus sp. A2-2]
MIDKQIVSSLTESVEYPVHWKTSTIGELCSKVTDGSHNPPKAKEIGLPMLSAKNISCGKIDFSQKYRLISEEDFEIENKRTQIEPGDVLLTIVGTLWEEAQLYHHI